MGDRRGNAGSKKDRGKGKGWQREEVSILELNEEPVFAARQDVARPRSRFGPEGRSGWTVSAFKASTTGSCLHWWRAGPAFFGGGGVRKSAGGAKPDYAANRYRGLGREG